MTRIEWDNANNLELNLLLSMAEDGYEFCISDGRIRAVDLYRELAA